MPDPDDRQPDETGTEGQAPEGQAPEGYTDRQPDEPGHNQHSAGAQDRSREGTQQVRHSDWKRVKDEQRARGRREAIDELDAKARAAGFNSHDDALAALAAINRRPVQQQTISQPQGAPTMPPKQKTQQTQDADRLRAENLRAQEDKAAERKKWRLENRRNRELQEQLKQKDAEIELREECYRAGVKDVDYVIRLLARELKGKTPEEINVYDRKAFYDRTRKDMPYLYGETVVAATTGTGGEPVKIGDQATGAPATPAPGAGAVGEAQRKKFDARTAKPEEVQARLRELGLNPHL